MDISQMSRLPATITAIESQDILNIVTFSSKNFQLKMVSLELDERATIGRSVIVGAKATTVAIAKDFEGVLSFSNQIPLTIKSIQQGKIVSNLILKEESFELESIITTESLLRMQLQKNQNVIALIKSSDLSIVEFL